MVCPDAEEWWELAEPTRRAWLEAHLDECAACRELAAALAGTRTGPGALAAPELAASGARIGRYVIEAPLGAGGMGIVFAAFDSTLERSVALKLVRVLGRSADDIAAARARLATEAKAMARVSHPNVVAVFEIVEAGDETFIAMERVDGVNLAAWLADGSHGAAERRRVALEIGSGVAAAHAAGIVHRDIKPSNVLVGRDGRARITDLGLAAIAAAPPAAAESSARLVGTPDFVAPEVAAGARADARSDQYSYALTAWQVLFGGKPRESSARSPMAQVLRRALADDPAERHESVAVLVERLERASRRARWAALAVAGVVSAALVGVLAWPPARGDRLAACAGDPSLDGAWTWQRRAGLAFELARRDQSPDHRVAGATLGLIDRDAARWSDAVVAACRDARRGTESAALVDRRTLCLEDARRDVVARLDAMSSDTSASAALGAIAQLPAPDACSHPDDAGAGDEAHRRALDELRAIDALSATGHYAAVGPRLDALAASAPATDLSLAARIAYHRADLAERGGHPEAALGFAHDAVALAERAHDDATRLTATTMVVRELQDAGRTTEAKALTPLLEAAAARDALDDARRAKVEAVLGNVAESDGAYPDAERHYRAALAAARREYGDAPAAIIAGMLESVGTILHDEGHADAARDLQLESLAMFEQVLGPAHPDLALPLSELAGIAFDAGDNDRAAAYEQRVLDIRTAALGADHPYQCETLAMFGRIERARHHDDRAEAMFRRAVAIGQHAFAEPDPLLAEAELRLAELLEDRGHHAEAEQVAAASVAIWDALSVQVPDAPSAKFLLARIAWDRGERSRAVKLASAARASYQGLSAPFRDGATTIATWLASHPDR